MERSSRIIDPTASGIDLTQVHSQEHSEEPSLSQLTTGMGPVTIIGGDPTELRSRMIEVVKDLQRTTQEAFLAYDADMKVYLEQINELNAAQSERIIELELVVDSLVKLFALGTKMPDEVLAQHQEVLSKFLTRDDLVAPAGSVGG